MHTPGPWHAKAPNDVNINWWIEVRRGGYKSLICETTNCLGNGGTAEANARLIAAAPELLAALEAMTEYAERYADIIEAPQGKTTMRDIKLARTAITKARGE